MDDSVQNFFERGPVVVFQRLPALGWPVSTVSANVYAQFGYEASILQGRLFASIVHPDDLRRIAPDDAAYLDLAMDSSEQEYRLLHADGGYRWVRDYTTVTRNPQGQAQYFYSYLLDITNTVEESDRLRASEARNQALLHAIPDLIFRFNHDGIYLDACIDQARWLLTEDLPDEQVLGHTLHDLLPADVADLILRHIRLALETGQMQAIEYRLPTLSGMRDFEARLVVSGPDEVVSIARDVSARKQAEAERERMIEDLDAFAGNVAHDLKGPLTGMVGYAAVLGEQIEEGDLDGVSESAAMVQLHVQKLTHIIDDLLLLARVRQDMPVLIEALDMVPIVVQALRRLDYLIRAREAVVTVTEGVWPMAMGYAPWVEAVWTNYISNALKYGGNPAHITLGVDPPKAGYVRFWVRDNGTGIAAQNLERLFEPFARFNPGAASGHGLGLSIVRRIVSRLNGTVQVESTPGQGSTFSFVLPAVNPET